MAFKLILGVMALLVLLSQAESDQWLKLNNRPVCYGARSNQYGSFNVAHGGSLAAIQLVHLSGYVSCDTGSTNHWSYWGCGSHSSVGHLVDVAITTATNVLISPPSKFIIHSTKWSMIPGFNSMSPHIVLPFFSPYAVNSGQELRVWYGEDLVNNSEQDNGGMVCCDVYALYV